MNAQAIVNLIVGLIGIAISAWKGPTVWGSISAAIGASCLAIGTLKILPQKDQDYITELETALQQAAPDVAKKLMAARRSKPASTAAATILMTVVLPIASLCGIATVATQETACNATAAQVGQTFVDGLSAAACILSKVLIGITDVPSLLGCAGATEQTIIDVLNDFKAQRTQDAGLAQQASDQQMKWVDEALANATKSLAKKAPGK